MNTKNIINSRGFTLVELQIALAIGVVVILAMIVMISDNQKSSPKGVRSGSENGCKFYRPAVFWPNRRYLDQADQGTGILVGIQITANDRLVENCFQNAQFTVGG